MGGIGSGIIALPLGLITLRFRGFYFAMATLGLAEITHLALRAFNLAGGEAGIWLPRIYSKGTLYSVAMGGLILTVIICHFIENSQFGRKIKLINEDEEAAKAIGLNTPRYKLYTFLISTFFAGIGGSLAAIEQTVLVPVSYLAPGVSFKIIMITMIGGIGAIPGQLIGAAFINLTENILAMYLTAGALLIFGISLIAVVLFLPGGIYGGIKGLFALKKRRRMEL